MANFMLNLQGKDYPITMIDSEFDFAVLDLLVDKTVNILASGSSINQVDFSKICEQPCLFVNGSIELTQRYVFIQATGYVISDPRFIRHNLAILQTCYHAQCPLLITQSVLLELAKKCPEFICQFYPNIYLIFAVDRPILAIKKLGWLMTLKQKLFDKKCSLANFVQSPHHIIKDNIGTSLDIRQGFVEAGTVAFVATQLAFSMGFKDIRLFGVDLINASEPRFYENHQNTAPSKLEVAIYNRIVPSFDLLATTYSQQGVTVGNASPISKDLFTFLPFIVT